MKTKYHSCYYSDEPFSTNYTSFLDIGGYQCESSGALYLGRYAVEARQDVELDWEFYSKSWHRSFGPKVTTSNRRIEFTREFRGKPKTITVPLAGWRGDYLARAVVEAGLAPKHPRYGLKIRLHQAYDAKRIGRKRGYTFYQRTLLGEHYDYVIISPLGMVYHDHNRANLIKGLHAKIRSQSRKLRGRIDWALCKKLGFCDSGIRAFCDAYGFSVRGKYAPEEIEHAVRKDPAAATPFMAELKTLAGALNYHTNWS